MGEGSVKKVESKSELKPASKAVSKSVPQKNISQKDIKKKK